MPIRRRRNRSRTRSRLRYLQYRGILGALLFAALLAVGSYLLLDESERAAIMRPPAVERPPKATPPPSPTPRRYSTIAGPSRVIDGDTLEIEGNRIRLYGIDTPERGQLCHRGSVIWDCASTATSRLAEVTEGRAVSCEVQDTDRYGRLVAICWLGDTELNGMMVAEGLALAYRQYSSRYVSAEMLAREFKRGLWGSDVEFTPPARYRARQPVELAPR